MAEYDFEPPSFSLGFDFDVQSEPQNTPQSDTVFRPAKRPSTASNLRTIEEDDDFESPVRVSDPPRDLKRLRRGPTARPASEDRKVEFEDPRCNVDDDIEDFSSEEERPRAGSLPSYSVCSSSKPSLHGQRVVTLEFGSQWKSRKGKEVSSASGSVDFETGGNNVIFPELTVSPLRRFQLIDSDSDDPSVIEDTSKEMPHIIFSSKDKQSDSSKHAALSNLGTKKAPLGKSADKDLWKDFCTEKSSRIPTPAFDEVCNEYFTNVKSKSKPEIDCNDTSNGKKWDETSFPPAHCYFFHKDSRIQKLVRDRLPYFFPLGAGNNQEHKQQNVSVIDYMGQFGHGENSRQTDRRQNVKKSSTRSKKSATSSKVGSLSQDSENWVNPKSCTGLQKNVGSRRVQAASNSVSKSVGHWFMGGDGRRVYVNKNGQELTGQIAYRHYRKESGKGYKNSKKKTAAKKKPAAKKK